MVTFAIVSCQHVKQKRLHIVVKRFVIKEKLRQQTQILTVNFVGISVHFEHRDFAATIDFCAGRVAPCTFVEVTIQYKFALRILQAELAEKQFW